MKDLGKLNELAKAYASSYASPHHITFTVEGLRNFFAALASQEATAPRGTISEEQWMTTAEALAVQFATAFAYYAKHGGGDVHGADSYRETRAALLSHLRLRASVAGASPLPTASEVLVLLIHHDGDDSPSVALARNRSELLEQVKVAVWGEPHPADTTNDFGDDMAEGITDTLLGTGAMIFEGDPPLRLVRIPVEDWFATSGVQPKGAKP